MHVHVRKYNSYCTFVYTICSWRNSYRQRYIGSVTHDVILGQSCTYHSANTCISNQSSVLHLLSSPFCHGPLPLCISLYFNHNRDPPVVPLHEECCFLGCCNNIKHILFALMYRRNEISLEQQAYVGNRKQNILLFWCENCFIVLRKSQKDHNLGLMW